MGTLNQVTLIGRLGHPPELFKSKTGKSYTRLSLATDRYRKGAEEEETTDWHSVFVWGAQAEVCVEHLRPGAVVAIEGSLTYWQVAQEEKKKQYKNAIQAERVNIITFGGARADDAANLDISEGPRNHNAVAHPLM